MSGPTVMRMKWGTISPANIMIPPTDTLIPVSMDAVMKSIFFDLSMLMPRPKASSSPRESALRSRQKKSDMTSPVSAPMQETLIRVRLVSSREPMIQNTMVWSSSLLETAMSSITREEETKLIMTPVSSIVSS